MDFKVVPLGICIPDDGIHTTQEIRRIVSTTNRPAKGNSLLESLGTKRKLLAPGDASCNCGSNRTLPVPRAPIT
jgi:hypothetical protein